MMDAIPAVIDSASFLAAAVTGAASVLKSSTAVPRALIDDEIDDAAADMAGRSRCTRLGGAWSAGLVARAPRGKATRERTYVNFMVRPL